MVRRVSLVLLAAVALVAASLSAGAYHRDRVAVGTLECRSPGAVSFVLTINDYSCRFYSNTGRAYRYQGRAHRLGFEFGITRDETLVWHVFAPTHTVDSKALHGAYVGGHAGASVGIGLGANVLVGGWHNSIVLQPVSLEATRGINVALSVSGLSLR